MKLVFLSHEKDDVEVGRSYADAIPRPGDNIWLDMAVHKDSASLLSFSFARYRVVSVAWDLKNVSQTESWIKQTYSRESQGCVLLTVEPLDDTTRAYIERCILADQAEEGTQD